MQTNRERFEITIEDAKFATAGRLLMEYGAKEHDIEKSQLYSTIGGVLATISRHDSPEKIQKRVDKYGLDKKQFEKISIYVLKFVDRQIANGKTLQEIG